MPTHICHRNNWPNNLLRLRQIHIHTYTHIHNRIRASNMLIHSTECNSTSSSATGFLSEIFGAQSFWLFDPFCSFLCLYCNCGVFVCCLWCKLRWLLCFWIFSAQIYRRKLLVFTYFVCFTHIKFKKASEQYHQDNIVKILLRDLAAIRVSTQYPEWKYSLVNWHVYWTKNVMNLNCIYNWFKHETLWNGAKSYTMKLNAFIYRLLW